MFSKIQKDSESLRSKYGRESKELAHKKVDTNLTKKTILHINNTLLDIGLKHPSISNPIWVIALENAKIPRAIIFLAIYWEGRNSPQLIQEIARKKTDIWGFHPEA